MDYPLRYSVNIESKSRKSIKFRRGKISVSLADRITGEINDPLLSLELIEKVKGKIKYNPENPGKIEININKADGISYSFIKADGTMSLAGTYEGYLVDKRALSGRRQKANMGLEQIR